MNQQQPTSWQDLMSFAFGVLKLTPDTFWAMTPREFDAAARPFLAQEPSNQRAVLDAFMKAFPDP